jgi:hypothetical protein
VAVQTIATTVGTSPTQIIPAEAYAMPGSVQTIISNTSSGIVYIGPAGVTASTGVAIAANSNLNLGTLNSQLYAVVGTGTATVVVGLFS